jgi:hypothetical protein
VFTRRVSFHTLAFNQLLRAPMSDPTAVHSSRMTAEVSWCACGFGFFLFLSSFVNGVWPCRRRRVGERAALPTVSSLAFLALVPSHSVVRACFVRWRESKKKPWQTGWAGGVVAIQRQTAWLGVGCDVKCSVELDVTCLLWMQCLLVRFCSHNPASTLCSSAVCALLRSISNNHCVRADARPLLS